MSPNMKILKNLLSGGSVLLTGLVKRFRVRRMKVTVAKQSQGPRHYLGSHAESKYVWTIIEAIHGPEDSQEIRLERADRRGERQRVNGFLTVDMILGRNA